jgi:hypothetical protein
MLQSLPPRDFPKLPIQLLEDVRPQANAGLYIVAMRLAGIKRSSALKVFEWLNPGSRRFNLENLELIRAELMRAGLLKMPVVAAHPSCGVDGQKALEAARKLQATVVEDLGECVERGNGSDEQDLKPKSCCCASAVSQGTAIQFSHHSIDAPGDNRKAVNNRCISCKVCA